MNPFWKVAGKVCPIFRAKRLQRFTTLFKPDRKTRILDVGGVPHFWTIPIEAQITILNVKPLEDYELAYMPPNMTSIVADGTRLPFEDDEFDIVFSNSVIEHLGTADNQRTFAREVQRVGKSYWIQTPAYEFPVEPHFFTPFVHWLPKCVRRHLLRNFTLWGLMGRPNQRVVDMTIDEIRLLKYSEFKALFPESDIWVERLLGFSKSYTAYKLPAVAPVTAKVVLPPAQVLQAAT